LSVRWGHEHGRAKPLYKASRVALVPRGNKHDPRLAVGRELDDLARRGQRVEEQEMLTVVDCVRRDHLAPRLARRPVRVRCLPMPEATL